MLCINASRVHFLQFRYIQLNFRYQNQATRLMYDFTRAAHIQKYQKREKKQLVFRWEKINMSGSNPPVGRHVEVAFSLFSPLSISSSSSFQTAEVKRFIIKRKRKTTTREVFQDFLDVKNISVLFCRLDTHVEMKQWKEHEKHYIYRCYCTVERLKLMQKYFADFRPIFNYGSCSLPPRKLKSVRAHSLN